MIKIHPMTNWMCSGNDFNTTFSILSTKQYCQKETEPVENPQPCGGKTENLG